MKRILSVVAVLLVVTLNPLASIAADKPDFGIPVIANKDNTLPKELVPKVVKVEGTYFQLEQETLDAYLEMLSAAKEAGHTKLRIQSAYRSYATQNILYENKVKEYEKDYGDKARELAAMIVAKPGQSEHQLGNTIDIANGSLVQSFGKTTAGIWLAENAHLYGFTLRYPEGKTDITGVVYEPWHFRFVGKDFAAYLYENELTLEEYIKLVSKKQAFIKKLYYEV